MKICLITPAPAHSRKGNRVTALRWAHILRELGHHVFVEERFGGRACDLMVALHARRSFDSVENFRKHRPDLPLVLALTGTDLYADIHTNPQAQRSLEMATRLILLQPMGIAELPKRLRSKARVIFQSVQKLPGKFPPRKGIFEVGVMGHLRPVKDPFRAAKAARLLPDSSRIQVVHVGAALSEAMEKAARAEQHSNPRYRWLGELPRWKALRLMARCRVLVLSSKMEGGANVLSEAVAISVPALASRIPGSVGILGPKYPGYFPVGDARALANLMNRAERDPGFLSELKSRLKLLEPLVDPARELESWKCLLEELDTGNSPSLTAAEGHETTILAGSPTPSTSIPRRSPRRNPTQEPSSDPDKRFKLIDLGISSQLDEFAREVRAGLTTNPKQLSCRFFYDREGSQLFEEISELPEYYLMRVEREILCERAGEIAELFQNGFSRGGKWVPKRRNYQRESWVHTTEAPPGLSVFGGGKIGALKRQKVVSDGSTLVELGSGSAAKTRILIDELLRRLNGNATLRYVPVDISRAMLEESSRALLEEYPALEMTALAGEYYDCIPHLNSVAGSPKLILWLGSNVGNLDRPEAASFLRLLGGTMKQHDRLLIGIDLRKDRGVLERAYDDTAKVTARFNRNILARINRELGGHFDLSSFEHRAFYDDKMGRIEMYLVSTRTQRVRIDRLDLEVSFAAREQIHTENSYKYSLEEIQDLAASANFCIERQWLDPSHRFSVNLMASLE